MTSSKQMKKSNIVNSGIGNSGTANSGAVKSKEAVEKVTSKTAAKAGGNPVLGSPAKVTSQKITASKTVKRKELVERISEKSGLMPVVVKAVLDAVLQEVGDILSAGDALQVQPLGKVGVKRKQELPGTEILTCKIRRKISPETPPESDEAATD